jgi:hypothetical protein
VVVRLAAASRSLIGLLVAACAAGGCEWIAGIEDLHPPEDAGVSGDARVDGRPDAQADVLPGDAPLDAPATDAPDDAATDDAPPVDSGPEAAPDCSAGGCPNGCCNNSNVCVTPAYPRCGKGGVQCVWCDEERTDNCDNEGACACGGSAACTGSYYCGSGSCDFCGATTCASGCCDSLVCVRGPVFPRCGVLGGSCQTCTTLYADRCTNGACACGDGPPCPGTGPCVGGVCQ